MKNSPFRTLVIGVTIVAFLASDVTLRSIPALAQQGAGESFLQVNPFDPLGSSLLSTIPSQILNPQQTPGQIPFGEPRRPTATPLTNPCPASWSIQATSAPRARSSSGGQTTGAGGAPTQLEQGPQGPTTQSAVPEFEEISPIEATFRTMLHSFLGFASSADPSQRQAFAYEVPQAARPAPVGQRQMAIQQAEIALQPRAQQQQLPEPELQPRTQAQPRPAFIDPFATPLRQYGYSLFSGNVSTFAPVDNVPVGPDYVVGPGDDLFINVWGPADSFLIRTVDRNGRIILPKVGDLQVWGLTFSQAERLIREQLSRYFRGYQTSVTMGRLRTVRVHVVGEVCQPGSFVLSSLSTLTNALFSAGGPTKLGSLRDVRLLRNGHTVGTLDLYEFLQRGDRTRDYRLESGDTIFVPTIGEVAAVAGEVKRPAIYEIRGDVRLADLIEMAGGVTPSSHLKRVQIVRSLPSAERVTIDVDLTDYYLKQNAESNPPVNDGDLVLIHRSDPRIYNTVKVDGAVKYPGVYELKPMMRVSQLLPSAKLLPEAFPDRVEITRRRPDLSIEIIQVNLKKAWSGDADQDPLLRPLDEIAVRTELRAVRTATLSGQVVRPGTYTIAEGEWLSSVLERAGGFTERAHLKGAIFTRASLRKVEQEQLDSFVKMQEQRILAAASTAVVGGETGEAALSAQTIQARLGLLRALAKRVAVGRMVVRLAPPEKLKNGSDDIVLIDGDSLEIPEPNSSVLVVGAVRNSTSVSYLQGANLEYYVHRVGGFSREADKKEVHLVKADGSALSGFANVRSVESGDTIVVPPREETRVRVLPTIRDSLSILASTLTTVLSAAALALLF